MHANERRSDGDKGGKRPGERIGPYLQNITAHAYPDASSQAIPDISSPCRRIRNTKSRKALFTPHAISETGGLSAAALEGVGLRLL